MREEVNSDEYGAVRLQMGGKRIREHRDDQATESLLAYFGELLVLCSFGVSVTIKTS